MPKRGRLPTDHYTSKIALKLGVEKDEIFRTIRSVGYSLEVDVHPICPSDIQRAGDIFKASELNFNTHTVNSMRASLEQSLRALELNPTGLPAAHVTAAYDYLNLGMAAYAAESPLEVIPKARWHATETLKLDPASSRALGVLGLISLIFDYDWDSAKAQFKCALEIDPNDSATLLSYAHYLAASGEFGHAIEAVTRAAQIDSTDLIINASVGWLHLFAGDYRTAIECGEHTKFLYPDFPAVYMILGWAYEAAERFDEALSHYRISLEKEYSPAALASLGHLEAVLGNEEGGRTALREFDRLYEQGKISYVPGYSKALIFAGLNEVDQCVIALEEGYDQRCDWLIHLNIDRRWDAVRRSSGFQSVVEKVCIPIAKPMRTQGPAS
jgi:tetratricopeptide (TPR) repeat protein